MSEIHKKSDHNCDECDNFLRMYKGAGVGTCRIGSKKYRSEDASCDISLGVTEVENESMTSGFHCHDCGEDIIDSEFNEEQSIGHFDDSGNDIHYYCSNCWTEVSLEREKFRKQFEIP